MTLLHLLSFSLFFVSTISSCHGLEIGVYWGQGRSEGSLGDTCATGNYKIVNIAFLNLITGRETPLLMLSTHCDPTTRECTKLSKEIKSCQALGIKVFLAIGGGAGSLFVNTTLNYATNNALYLWNNFLSGESSSRPLGDAVLDGIDFIAAWDPSSERREKLAAELIKYKKQSKRKMYLSASLECPYPDVNLQPALDTGAFDYVWVMFYNNPRCDYSKGNIENLLKSWNVWTKTNAGKVFMELPAAPEVAKTGYIPPDVVRNRLLPELKRNSKFGGVVLWSREYDKGYSSSINQKVCGLAMSNSRSDHMAMIPMGGKLNRGQGFRTCKGTCVL